MSTTTQSTTQSKPTGDSAGKSKFDPAVRSDRQEQGQAIIRRNVLWSLGAGVVPIPVFDVLAIAAVEAKMLKELSDLYGVKFSDGVAKKVTASLLTSVGSVGIGGAIAGSLLKVIPVVGSTLGMVSVPVFAGAFTHAMGTVFLMHFETGGTLLDFNPRTVREHFKQEFDKAKVEVTQLQQEQAARNTKA